MPVFHHPARVQVDEGSGLVIKAALAGVLIVAIAAYIVRYMAVITEALAVTLWALCAACTVLLVILARLLIRDRGTMWRPGRATPAELAEMAALAALPVSRATPAIEAAVRPVTPAPIEAAPAVTLAALPVSMADVIPFGPVTVHRSRS